MRKNKGSFQREKKGERIDDQMSEIRNKQIGFIFQGFNLISSLNAMENVELPLVYRGVPKQERHELSTAALKKVGLGERMHYLPKRRC